MGKATRAVSVLSAISALLVVIYSQRLFDGGGGGRQQRILDSWNVSSESVHLSAREQQEMSARITGLVRDNTGGTKPLRLKRDLEDLLAGGRGQPLVVDALLGEKQNGFFVEAGASDGQVLSNSLFFETKRNWTGLLVEANPEYYTQLLDTNRRAFTINCCLGTSLAPQRLEFLLAGVKGRIRGAKSERAGIPPGATVREIDCFPLAAILQVINRTKIDFLSLDLEGAEVPVLSLIPFDQLDIGVLMTEVSHISSLVQNIKLKTLFKMLDGAGFDFLGLVGDDAIFGNRKWDLKVGTASLSEFSAVTDRIQESLGLQQRDGNYRPRIQTLLERLQKKGEI